MRAHLLAGLMMAAGSSSAAFELDVLGTDPSSNRLHVPVGAAISVTFDHAVQPPTVTRTTFRVFGRNSGAFPGSFAFSNGDRTVTFTPARPFSPGELVTVNLARSIFATDGSPLRDGGYAFQFWAAAGVAGRVFTHIGTLNVRSGPPPGAPTQAYGAMASDFNGDGALDLAIVNEVSADLRMFLNRADGSGLYHPFLPPAALGRVASPNEPADFNNDGFTDAAVANVQDGTVSIVLGRGDGTFEPQQVVRVGSAPRGLAVLDFDGDGDPDVVTANYGASNLSLLANNGSGVFTGAGTIDGGAGEYGLAAGDMDNDGIFDLVVGARTDQKVHVLLGNGDRTFRAAGTRGSLGVTWMVALGDVTGDGALDAAVANGQSNNGAIVEGRGDGTLRRASLGRASAFVLASDLGDLDGDGDLDWVLSAYGGRRWHVYQNDGGGSMGPEQVIPAPAAGSCAVFLDFDADGDLDLALIDEVADVVLLMRNDEAAAGPAGEAATVR